MYRLENIAERIADTLDQVGLAERKNDLVRTFSRGMQQRLSIGRALLADPKIILLDEPFSGLDQSAIENFVDLFTSLISLDRMIVMTTHDLHLGLQLATHFAVITRGKLVQQGLTNSYNLDGFKARYRQLTGESH
jgi:heme exporter protein A